MRRSMQRDRMKASRRQGPLLSWPGGPGHPHSVILNSKDAVDDSEERIGSPSRIAAARHARTLELRLIGSLAAGIAVRHAHLLAADPAFMGGLMLGNAGLGTGFLLHGERLLHVLLEVALAAAAVEPAGDLGNKIHLV